MAILSIPTYEPGLATASPVAGFILTSNPTSAPPPPPQPTAAPSGAIQLSTIFGIVIGFVGFVVLILACSFISRLPCFRKPQDNPATSPQPRLWTIMNIRRHLHRINAPRPRGRPVQHVVPPVVSLRIPMGNRTQSYDHNAYPPPYGGPSPPPYSEGPRYPPAAHAPPSQGRS